MNFEEDLYNLIKQIPEAKFTTYRALAKAMGDVRAARAVSQTIYKSSKLSSFSTCVLSDDDYIKNKPKFENKLFNEFITEFPLKNLREEQLNLRAKISLENDFKVPKNVVGVDIAYPDANKAIGACAIFDYNRRELIGTLTTEAEITFPYISTYLGFREMPVIKKLVAKLDLEQSILMTDGNGVLHPFGLGIASHIGVTLDLSTIGVAKSLLCGTLEKEPKFKGEFAKIFYNGVHAGYALISSSESQKPIYISPGHKISFDSALKLVQCFCKSRIPEPIKEAHKLSTQMKKKL